MKVKLMGILYSKRCSITKEKHYNNRFKDNPLLCELLLKITNLPNYYNIKKAIHFISLESIIEPRIITYLLDNINENNVVSLLQSANNCFSERRKCITAVMSLPPIEINSFLDNPTIKQKYIDEYTQFKDLLYQENSPIINKCFELYDVKTKDTEDKSLYLISRSLIEKELKKEIDKKLTTIYSSNDQVNSYVINDYMAKSYADKYTTAVRLKTVKPR